MLPGYTMSPHKRRFLCSVTIYLIRLRDKKLLVDNATVVDVTTVVHRTY